MGHLGKSLIVNGTIQDGQRVLHLKRCKDWTVRIALEAAEAAFRSANATWLFDMGKCFSFYFFVMQVIVILVDWHWFTGVLISAHFANWATIRILQGGFNCQFGWSIHVWSASHLLPWIIGSHRMWIGQDVLGCGWIEIMQKVLGHSIGIMRNRLSPLKYDCGTPVVFVDRFHFFSLPETCERDLQAFSIEGSLFHSFCDGRDKPSNWGDRTSCQMSVFRVCAGLLLISLYMLISEVIFHHIISDLYSNPKIEARRQCLDNMFRRDQSNRVFRREMYWNVDMITRPSHLIATSLGPREVPCWSHHRRLAAQRALHPKVPRMLWLRCSWVEASSGE